MGAFSRMMVYNAIDHERAYQDKKWSEDLTASGGKHTPDEWLLYIEDYVDEARRYTTRHSNPGAADLVLHTMRKIAAMAVACMEQNGVRTRVAS